MGPLLIVLLGLVVGPALAWAVGTPTSRGVRRGLALVVMVIALVMLPHAWGHAGIVTLPAILVGLAMAHQIHRGTGVGLAATLVGVGLLAVHVLLDGSALAVHDEPALPWLLALHRVPVGITIMAMAVERYGVDRGRVAGSLVIVLLIVLTAIGWALTRHFVGEASELVSGVTEAWVIGAMGHVVVDGFTDHPHAGYQGPGTQTSSAPPSPKAGSTST